MQSDSTAVRPGEELNAAALAAYLTGIVDGAERGVVIEQFPSGHSNLTYLLRIEGREYVLRRAPLGPVAPKAHDMAREFRVLQAVHPHFPEAPAAYHLCEDEAVAGAVFLLMQRRHGIILRDDIPAEIAAIPEYPRLVSEALVDCLVRLHSVDVAATGLIGLGRPEGFTERQVRGWAERWNRAATEAVPDMDRVTRWLVERLPPPSAPTLVHNDYKLDNVMLRSGSPGRIEAVLDWEMATVGDPLADLGLTLAYWAWATAQEVSVRKVRGLTSLPGWHTRDQFARRYADRTGRDLTHLGYHEVLGVFKLAVIVQQIYFRYYSGQTRDSRFRDFGERVKGLAKLAALLAAKHD